MDYSRMYISGMDGCGRGLRRNTQLLFSSFRLNQHIATSQYYEKRGVINHREIFVLPLSLLTLTNSTPEIEGNLPSY